MVPTCPRIDGSGIWHSSLGVGAAAIELVLDLIGFTGCVAREVLGGSEVSAALVLYVCKARGTPLSAGRFHWEYFFVSGDVHLSKDLAEIFIFTVGQHWSFRKGCCKAWVGM